MTIHQFHCFFIPFLSFLLLGCSANETKTDLSPVASVGTVSITVESLRARFGDKIKDSVFVYSFLSSWMEKELLYLGGVSQEIDRDKSVFEKTSDYKKELVGTGFLSLNIKEHQIEKSNIIKYYTENKGEYKRKLKEMRVSFFTTRVRSTALKIKRKLKQNHIQKNSDVLSLYGGVRKVFLDGEFPPKFNDNVFNKKNFKKGNLLGPYSVDNNYYIIKIEEVFQVGSYLEIDLVYDEIYQRLKNKAHALRYREVVDSLWLEYPVKVDSQRIRNLIK